MSQTLARSLLVLPFFLAAPAQAAEQSSPAPCMPYVGEKLRYAVGWEFINAGSATMNITARGQEGYRIRSFARTNSFFDMFKKVRDTIVSEGICRDGALQSTRYASEQLEVEYSAKKEARFLWREDKVRFEQNGREEEFDVEAGYLNVLDAFFAVRMMPLTPGEPVRINIFDNRKRYEAVVRVLGKEKILAPWGRHEECVVIEPKLKTEGIFTSKGKIRIWLTDDERRIPVKMTAGIRIGHIVARLTDYSRK